MKVVIFTIALCCSLSLASTCLAKDPAPEVLARAQSASIYIYPMQQDVTLQFYANRSSGLGAIADFAAHMSLESRHKKR